MSMVELENVSKRFDDTTAVDSVSFTVGNGETFGILGPNGAGKTTILSIIVGRLAPSSGEVRIHGQTVTPNSVELRRQIGVVPENHPRGVWNWMTGRDYLKHFTELFGEPWEAESTEKISDYVGLGSNIRKHVSTYSRGMLQRLSLARALLANPRLLILDEAISGLDPAGVRMFRDIIVDQKMNGRTIIISSHLISEIEKVCDKVAVISGGHLLAIRPLSEGVSLGAHTTTISMEVDPVSEEMVRELRGLSYVVSLSQTGNHLNVAVNTAQDVRRDLSSIVARHKASLIELYVKSQSLEDYYMDITEQNVATIAGVTADGE